MGDQGGHGPFEPDLSGGAVPSGDKIQDAVMRRMAEQETDRSQLRIKVSLPLTFE